MFKKENMSESISSKERYVEKFDIAPQVAEIIASIDTTLNYLKTHILNKMQKILQI